MSLALSPLAAIGRASASRATRASETLETIAPPQRVLVVEPWGIGDVVLVTPALRAIRRRWPDAQLTLLARPFARELLAGDALVDDVLSVDLPWTATSGKYRLSRYGRAMRVIISTLRAREFDLSFDARMDARNDLLLWGAKVRRRVGFGDGGGEALLTDRVASPGAATHRIDDWRQLLAAAGIALDEPSPRLSVNAHERAEGAERLRALGLDPDSPIVAVHAGASDARKQWGIERFDAVSRGVGRVAQVVAFEDPRAPRNAPLGNAPTLRLPLREYMSTVAACSAYVGNDSGATHVAAALGVPVLAIFGATRPEWFAPVGESHRVLSASGVRCDRCGDLCTHALPAAFDAVSIDAVVEAVLSRLPVRASAS